MADWMKQYQDDVKFEHLKRHGERRDRLRQFDGPRDSIELEPHPLVVRRARIERLRNGVALLMALGALWRLGRLVL